MAIPNSNVKKMQQALATYAKVTGYAAANPGPVDGIVGTQTVNAVIAMIPMIPKLPSEIKTLATIAPIILVDADAMKRAKSFITSKAPEITKGIVGLAAYQAGTGTLPTPVNPPTQLPVGPTAPGAATGGSNAIFFYDTRRGAYRVAVPAGLMGLGAAYREVAPTTVRPAGREVSRNDFYVATGQWYATWWGIGLLVAGGTAAVGGTALVIRRLRS